MSEKRFTFGPVSPNFAMIKDNGEPMDTEEVVDLLNEQQATIRKLQDLCGESDGENAKLRIENKEQQATINELQAQLREKEREERLYANEILELRETNKEHIKFKSLGGNY